MLRVREKAVLTGEEKVMCVNKARMAIYSDHMFPRVFVLLSEGIKTPNRRYLLNKNVDFLLLLRLVTKNANAREK